MSKMRHIQHTSKRKAKSELKRKAERKLSKKLSFEQWEKHKEAVRRKVLRTESKQKSSVTKRRNS